MSKSEFEDAELAWPEGDKPSGFLSVPASNEALELIESDIIPEINCVKWSAESITPQQGVVGRFRIKADENMFFLRVTSRIGHFDLEKKICDYLFENGASVNPVISTKTLFLKGKSLRLDLRPYINGVHFSEDMSQLENLGREISKIHLLLKDFSLSSEVREIASARSKHYKNVVDSAFFDISNICSVFQPYGDWAENNMQWLQEMAENFNPEFDLMDDAQCLHGEIHPGNVIYDKNDNRAVLLDFEESVHVFASVSWDLAFAVQRFILRDNPDLKTLKTRISSFEKGYGKKLPPLTPMMRQISWFTMAVIFDLFVNHSIITPISELEKFVRLERQAFSLSGAI